MSVCMVRNVRARKTGPRKARESCVRTSKWVVPPTMVRMKAARVRSSRRVLWSRNM